MSISPSLPRSADVVIIGGGVMGASIASHLVAGGQSDVVLLEASTLGSGSSAKPIGGFRAQFSDETNILLGLHSAVDYFHRFEERYGIDIGIDPCGYLFLITRDADVAAYERATEIQRSFGLDAGMIDPARVAELNPFVPADAVIAGQYAPLAGNAIPARILAGFIRHATTGGARVFENTPVTGITEVGADAMVETEHGTIRTGTVIITAGAWSRSIGAMAGLHLPVTPLRRQLAFTVPTGVAHPRIPFTLDAATTAYFHNVGPESLLFGLADPAQEHGFGRDYDDSWLTLFRDAAGTLAPAIAQAPVENGWAGLYEMTPDANALIGEADRGFRVLYAAGFSGHGVLQSPAVGRVVAELYRGERPLVDVTRFSADRFAGGSTGLERELAVI